MTEELIQKLKEAKSEGERMAILEGNSFELSEEELAKVAGGSDGSDNRGALHCPDY